MRSLVDKWPRSRLRSPLWRLQVNGFSTLVPSGIGGEGALHPLGWRRLGRDASDKRRDRYEMDDRTNAIATIATDRLLLKLQADENCPTNTCREAPPPARCPLTCYVTSTPTCRPRQRQVSRQAAASCSPHRVFRRARWPLAPTSANLTNDRRAGQHSDSTTAKGQPNRPHPTPHLPASPIQSRLMDRRRLHRHRSPV